MKGLSSLSPITQRRIRVFRQNRRARVSLWIFLALFIVSLGAELIANDKPLLLRYDGQWYTPLLVDYPETEFGGFLPTRTDYHDPFIQAQIAQHGWAIWPPIPFSYQTLDMQMMRPSPSPPDRRHWLGTDDQGRDVLARVIYGFRLSVFFALVLTAGSLAMGVVIGGYRAISAARPT